MVTAKKIMRKNLIKKVIAGTVGGLMSLIAGYASASIITSSVPETTNWERGQEYRVDVYGDSTQHPSSKIYRSEWQMNVPQGITPTRAEVPSSNNPQENPADFFYGFKMIVNGVDSSMDYLRNLADNTRMINTGLHALDGPSNRNALLGSYWFSVDADAPLGEAAFSFPSSVYYAWDGMFLSSTGTVVQNNEKFYIVPEASTVALLGIGAIGCGVGAVRNSRKRE